MRTWALILLATLLAYSGSLRYGFSQDDYYFLLISRASSIGDVLKFFSPWQQQGFAFFRPLGTQLYFYLFEQNAYAMHIFMLLVHAFNGYLVTRLLTRLKQKPLVSTLVGLLYATSATHFLSLYYIAATQQLLATTFSLLSLITFLDQKYWTSAFLLIGGLLSKETAIMTPAFAALIYELKHKKFNLRTIFPLTFPYLVVTASYLAFRLFGGLSVQSEYQPIFGPSVISTLRWYFLFGYGAPEELLHYSGAYLFINFLRFIHDLGWLATVSALSTISLSVTALIIAIRSLFKSKPLSRLKISIYFLWFLAGIFLVLFYPNHRYPHYLDLGLIPLLLIIIEGTKGIWRHTLVALLLAGSFSSILLSERVHWTTGRALMAERAKDFFINKHICDYDSVRFIGSGNAPLELSYTLSAGNGPTVICGHELTVRWGDEPGFTEGIFDITKVVAP